MECGKSLRRIAFAGSMGPIDLNRAPYRLNGVKYIDLVSLTPHCICRFDEQKRSNQKLRLEIEALKTDLKQRNETVVAYVQQRGLT